MATVQLAIPAIPPANKIAPGLKLPSLGCSNFLVTSYVANHAIEAGPSRSKVAVVPLNNEETPPSFQAAPNAWPMVL